MRLAPFARRISELWLYLPLTIAFTWPLVLHPATRLTAPITIGDPYLNLWILGWDRGNAVIESWNEDCHLA